MLGNETQCGEGFQPSASNVARAGIDHGVMVGKRNLSKKLPIAPAIKRSPATVFVLHGQNPTNCPLHSLSFPSLVRLSGKTDFGKSSEYLKSIVDIRIKLIGILEIPPSRFAFGILDLPVAHALDFLLE